MSDSRQPSLLIAAVASKLGEYVSANSDQHNYASVLQALNDEWSDLHSSIVALDADWFLDSSLISLVANQQEYFLPEMCMSIRRIELASSNVLFQSADVPIVPFGWRGDYDSAIGFAGMADALTVTLRGDYLHVMPTPTSAISNAFRLWYVRHPAAVHVASTALGEIQAGLASVKLAQTPSIGNCSSADDYNKGQRILLGDGDEGAQNDPQDPNNYLHTMQMRTITSYDGNTRIATLDAPVTGVSIPEGGDALTTYEILFSCPVNRTEVLVLGALRRCMENDGKADEWQADYGQTYSIMRNNLIAQMASRQTHQPIKRRIVRP